LARLIGFFVLVLSTHMIGATPLVVAQNAPSPSEQPVQLLNVAGPLSKRYGQFSGMAWYRDTLVLLPQYPSEYDSHLLTLPKQAIVDMIRGVNTSALQANLLPIFGHEAFEGMEGFEGFESSGFAGDRVYLTIETQRGNSMVGFLTTGLMHTWPTTINDIPKCFMDK
jgi:hypothetical protein